MSPAFDARVTGAEWDFRSVEKFKGIERREGRRDSARELLIRPGDICERQVKMLLKPLFTFWTNVLAIMPQISILIYNSLLLYVVSVLSTEIKNNTP